jgi:hypothetical protein
MRDAVQSQRGGDVGLLHQGEDAPCRIDFGFELAYIPVFSPIEATNSRTCVIQALLSRVPFPA